MHYLLTYELAPDYLERRGEFRTEHLNLAWGFQARGELVLAGALADPPDKAVLLFKCESAAPVQEFLEADPYVRHGLVKSHSIRQWTTVIGKDATTPIKP